jgi:hypothetical protein
MNFWNSYDLSYMRSQVSAVIVQVLEVILLVIFVKGILP